jgi:hypothetical protein
VVLQSEAETKENEVRSPALTATIDGLANWLWLLIVVIRTDIFFG